MRNVTLFLAIFTISLQGSTAHGDEAKAEQRYAPELRGKTWPEVFKWLGEVTGKPVIANYKVTGRCGLETSPGKLFTLGEIIDLLNQELSGNNARDPFYLIPRERTIALFPTKEPPDYRRRVTIEDLSTLPKTVPLTVEVVVTLKSQNAAKLVPEVEKMLDPRSQVIAIEGTNQLILEGRPGNLLRVVTHLQKLDKKTKPESGRKE